MKVLEVDNAANQIKPEQQPLAMIPVLFCDDFKGLNPTDDVLNLHTNAGNLLVVCARLRRVAGTQWGMKRYMCMKCLDELPEQLPSGMAG